MQAVRTGVNGAGFGYEFAKSLHKLFEAMNGHAGLLAVSTNYCGVVLRRLSVEPKIVVVIA